MRELISRKTRDEFREYFSGVVLREIRSAFDGAGVPIDSEHRPSCPGERRGLVEQYYHAIDFCRWDHVRTVLAVYENVLFQLEGVARDGATATERAFAAPTFASLRKWIERDGFRYSNGRLIPKADEAHIADAASLALKLDAEELDRQIDRIRASVDSDPRLAIGTAKELVETTCKAILDARGVSVNTSWDVVQLVKHTRAELHLLPESVSEATKGADIIRRLMSSLATLAQGLAELRNSYGTGHGPTTHTRGLQPRHARLAAGAATTLVTFLWETHEARPHKVRGGNA